MEEKAKASENNPIPGIIRKIIFGEVSNHRIVLKDFISGIPKETDMVLSSGTIRLKVPEGSNAVLVKNLYLAYESYMQIRMTDTRDYHFPSYAPGSVMVGYGVAKVMDSAHPNFKIGDVVWGMTGWEEYSMIWMPETLLKITYTDLPLSYYTGPLGMPGMTAYVGFHEVCSPKKGEYVLVSAAAGAVGQLVGQFAKLMGCYVVGCTSSDEKVDMLKNKFGFDEAFNEEEEHDLNVALKRYFPQGIDIYFENVGGAMLDAVLSNMRIRGRIAACGMVSQSQHNLEKSERAPNLTALVTKRIRMEGFMAYDYNHLYPQFLELTQNYIKQGKITYFESVVKGLENAPAALVGRLSGRNAGIQVVEVACE